MAKKKNNFSIYWIYALIGVSIIAFQLYSGQTETTKVEQNQLLTIADSTFAGVDQVTIINRASPDASAEFNLNKEGVKKILDSNIEDLSEIKESFCFLSVGHWLQGTFGNDRKNIGYTIKTFLDTFKNKPNP